MPIHGGLSSRGFLGPISAAILVVVVLLLPAFTSDASARAEVRKARERVLVRFRPGVAPSAARTLIRRAGVRQVRAIPSLHSRIVLLPAGERARSRALRTLRRSRAVASVVPDRRIGAVVRDLLRRARKSANRSIGRPLTTTLPPPLSPRTPNDPLWPEAWSLAKLQAPDAWGRTIGAPSEIVAVLDTGVDLSHPDLAGAFVPGYDFVNHDEDPSDDHGHGTMVAGIVAARSNNAVGIASACWSCSVMPIKVIGGNGLGYGSDIAAGIVWAVDHGARVLNMSFTIAGDDPSVVDAVRYARAHGAIVVASAGNTGGAEPSFPAAYSDVVGVAGTDGSDALYPWSTRGTWIDVAAPGCSLTTVAGGGYSSFCGTSSAAALVSGLVGLARSYVPLAPGEVVEQALRSSSAGIGDSVGSGRVDARALLAALAPA